MDVQIGIPCNNAFLCNVFGTLLALFLVFLVVGVVIAVVQKSKELKLSRNPAASSKNEDANKHAT